MLAAESGPWSHRAMFETALSCQGSLLTGCFEITERIGTSGGASRNRLVGAPAGGQEFCCQLQKNRWKPCRRHEMLIVECVSTRSGSDGIKRCERVNGSTSLRLRVPTRKLGSILS